jgi:hypothetical protein
MRHSSKEPQIVGCSRDCPRASTQTRPVSSRQADRDEQAQQPVNWELNPEESEKQDLIVRKAEQEGKALKTKIVLKYTYDDNYQLKRKARLVVCGYSQIAGVDFQETYAPTTNNLITGIVCQVSVANGWYMATMDVTAAFLEGTADCRMFARLPKRIDPDETRVEIIGNWYGLK